MQFDTHTHTYTRLCGDQTVKMHGNFEECPLNKCIVWVGDIVTPVHTYTNK